MTTNVPLKITLIISSTIVTLYIINKIVTGLDLFRYTPSEYGWVIHGFLNILGYSTIFLPGYLTYKYVRTINYTSKDNGGFCAHVTWLCFGDEESTPNQGGAATTTQRTRWQETLLILFHFCGLQISYLTWGVLQEKVMTQEYHSESGEIEYFKDSQFLVFVNRVLAFVMSAVYIFFHRQTRYRCPFYKYAFCSLSNIMSSWCQYEALKYVSFPHQVLAKAAKTIPVMIMGKIVSNTKYEYYEYVTSGILSVGMLMFMLDVGNDRADSAATTFSGVILLTLYIVFDSFTSNWQGALFKSYSIKPVHMMCFVNLFSCVFTSVSLLQQDAFHKSLGFMMKYPQFVIDCVLLSVCSATGQLFIFSTIAKFGPLIFAIITTMRQGFSVLLSCVIYNHVINLVGALGVVLVFVSVFLRMYCGHRLKNIRNQNIIVTKNQKIAV